MSIRIFPCQLKGLVFTGLWLAGLSNLSAADLEVAELPADRQVSYSRDIAPVIKRSCLACHNDQEAEGGVNLETVETMRASDVDEVLIPGKPDASRLFVLATHRDDPVMPPEDNEVSASTLRPIELALLRRWIETGAKVDAMQSSAQAIAFQPLPRQLKSNYSSAMTPDARLAAVSFGNRIQVFAGDDATAVAELTTVNGGQAMAAHQDFVRDLVLDAEGRQLISSGYRNVKIWARSSPDAVAIPTVDAPAVIAMAMNRTGTHVASLAPQGQVSVAELGKTRWDWTKEFDRPSSWLGEGAAVAMMAVNDLGDAVAVGSEKQLWILRVDAQQVEPIQLSADLTKIIWAPDGRLLMAGSGGQLWVASRVQEQWALKEYALLGESLTHFGIGAAKPTRVVAIDHAGHVATLDLDDGNVQAIGKLPSPMGSVAVFPDGEGLWAVDESGSLGVYRFAETKWVELAKSDPVSVERYQQTRWMSLVGERLVAADEKDLSQAEADVKAEQESLEALGKDLDAKTKTREEKQQAAKAAKLAAETATEKAAQAKAAQEQANLKRTELSNSIKKLDQRLDAIQQELATLKTQKADQEKQLSEIPDAKQLAEAVKSASDVAAKASKDSQAKQAELIAAESAVKATEETKKRGEKLLSELTEKVTQHKQVVQASEALQAERKKTEAAAKAIAEPSNASDRGLVVLAGAKRLLTYSEASSTWSLWSDSGHWLAQVPELSAQQAIVASGESNLLAKATDGTYSVVRFDPTRWQLARVIGSVASESPFVDRVLCLDRDPSGRYLATGGGQPSRNGELLIWDLADGQLVQRMDQPHSDTVVSLRFSPDGKTLASGGADRMIKLWNTADWSLIKTLEGHTHHVTAIDWNVNRRQLSSGSADETVKVWDVETGKAERTISGLKSEVTKLRYVGRDDRIAIACGDGSFRVYRTDDAKREINVKLPGGYLYTLGGDQEGTRFVVGGSSGQAVVVDQSGKQVVELNASE